MIRLIQEFNNLYWALLMHVGCSVWQTCIIVEVQTKHFVTFLHSTLCFPQQNYVPYLLSIPSSQPWTKRQHVIVKAILVQTMVSLRQPLLRLYVKTLIMRQNLPSPKIIPKPNLHACIALHILMSHVANWHGFVQLEPTMAYPWKTLSHDSSNSP